MITIPGQATKASMTALATSLHALLDTADAGAACWSDADTADFLKHQLQAPLLDDLSLLFTDAREVVGAAGVETFGDALLDASPDLPLLRMVREFAKQMSRQPSLYPGKAAFVLYYAAIAAAEVHAQQKITRLAARELQQGYRWSLEQDWLPAGLQKLFLSTQS